MPDKTASFVEQLLSNAIAPLITGIVTITVFAILLWNREKRRAATQLLQIFYTSETMLKARMLTHKYLIPGFDRSGYQRFAGKTFDQIEEILEQGDDQEGVVLILITDHAATRTDCRSGRSVSAIASPHRSLVASARS